MKSSQKGFGVVEVLLIIVIVGAVGSIGWYVDRSLRSTDRAYSSATRISNNASPKFTHKTTSEDMATLSGTVTESPTSPLAQPGNSGTAAVANHAIQAENAKNKVVASTKTDAQGKYTLHVPPGLYTLVLVPQIGPSAPADNTVQVTLGANTFNLSVDTGIR